MDIEANIHEYIHGKNASQGIKPLERYASFDYCFNYFQEFREQNRLDELTNTKYAQESCLQLGFYLASWGMLRGSSFLLTKSVKVFEELIEEISISDPVLWEIDVHNYSPANIQHIFEFRKKINSSLNFANGPSDILVTKIMLGVFGNVPAFDSYFKKGFGVSTFGRRALEKIGDFYKINAELIDKHRRPTLDFSTGQLTQRLYSRAKVIDMIFFIEGSK